MTRNSKPAPTQSTAPTPGANTSGSSLRSRLLALGCKGETSKMRGKAIVIVGAPRPKGQKASQGS